MMGALRSTKEWDIAIVGGGATGLGIAVDAASRGFSTILLEQDDFAKGTSSRSTKLIHGGVRYLKQGNVGLVIEALKERGLLCQNAPHLVHHLPFLVPNYHWWEGPFYGIGLKVYDLLAGKLGIEKSKHLTRAEVLEKLPTIEPKDLRGGTIYYDGQFDDARLAIVLAQTAAKKGACLFNYMPVTDLIKEGCLIKGVIADGIEIRAKSVINATGVFADHLRKIDGEKNSSLIEPSQGIHLVLDRSFLASDTAIMIPHTDDGRVLFFVPWLNHVLVGTTDTPIKNILLEPKPFDEEIEFLLTHAKKYLTKHPEPTDILSVFAGLRPLVRAGKGNNTAAVSRDHTILISDSGLITVAGGKWTTYRKMAEDAVNKAILVGHLPDSPCQTTTLRLYDPGPVGQGEKPLHPQLSITAAHITYSVDHEMAMHLEDLLARRTRSLFLNAKATMEIAETAAHLMAKALQKPSSWEKEEVSKFLALAKNYRIP